MNQIHSQSEGRLSSLNRGQTAQVDALLAQGAMRRRFQDLGLIRGTQVECLGRSSLGDPCAYLIRGAVIALRRVDADAIAIGPVCDAAAEELAVPAREQAVDHGTF